MTPSTIHSPRSSRPLVSALAFSLPLIAIAYALPAPATAAPYWVAWEGNDFPENEGWTRRHYGANGPAADRSLADGVMTLDGLASIEIVDSYRMGRQLNPNSGEEFVVQWRLRIDEVGNPNSLYDPGLAVYSDDAWHLIMVFGVNETRSVLEQRSVAFQPGVFHAWELRSPDMRTYTLSVDGLLVDTGSFTESGASGSRISWGDLVAGSNSYSEWDYFRFGVVPEPAAIWLVLVGLGAAAALRPRRSPGRLVFLSLLLCALSAPATATPYWVAYEGNDFPENEGWTRVVDGIGPADRTLDGGILTIDGLADRQIDDYYRMERSIDPEPGEEFVMQWRIRVDEIIGHPLGLYDPGLGLFSDDDWALAFVLGTDFIRSLHENVNLPFESGVFHVFDVRSLDMRTYELRMDQVLVHAGTFWEPTFTSSRIQWGDYTRGSASLVDWDYFRFGVVPESETGLLLCAFLMVHCATLSRRSTK